MFASVVVFYMKAWILSTHEVYLGLRFSQFLCRVLVMFLVNSILGMVTVLSIESGAQYADMIVDMVHLQTAGGGSIPAGPRVSLKSGDQRKADGAVQKKKYCTL